MKLFKKTHNMNNKLPLFYFIVLTASLLSACRGPKAKDASTSSASTSSASVSTASVSQEPREKYIVDQKESVITWYGSMLLDSKASHTGYVSISKGDLIIQKGQLAGGIIEVDMNTIADEKHGSNGPVLHLKSPDFFEVEKFPTATFATLRVSRANDTTVHVMGNLTIKDITEEVTFPAQVVVKDGVVHAHGKLTIDRTKWDVRYNSGKFFSILADEVISDAIEFDIRIVARKYR
jgi:polyisoprenoid-binding protein YceI